MKLSGELENGVGGGGGGERVKTILSGGNEQSVSP